MEWSLLDPSKNGGSPVTGYEIKFTRQGESEETVLVGAAETSYSVNLLIGGTTNTFGIAPVNKYGAGSHIFITVVAAQEPDTVGEPLVQVQQLNVLITWVKPFENYAPIDGCRVEVLDSSSVYADVTLRCNLEVLAFTLRTDCYIPMTTLIADLGLAYPDEIKVRIIARNDRGESVPSNPNTPSVIVEEVPRKMAAITMGSLNSYKLIHLEWIAPDNGGSEILGYIIYYKLFSASLYEELVGE